MYNRNKANGEPLERLTVREGGIEMSDADGTKHFIPKTDIKRVIFSSGNPKREPDEMGLVEMSGLLTINFSEGGSVAFEGDYMAAKAKYDEMVGEA